MLNHLAAIALIATAAAQDKAETPAAKPKKVCRVERNTGSRLGKVRVCKTAEQWTETDADNLRNAQGSLQSTAASTPR